MSEAVGHADRGAISELSLVMKRFCARMREKCGTTHALFKFDGSSTFGRDDVISIPKGCADT